MPGPVILFISTDKARIEKRIEGSQLDSYTIGRGADSNLFLNLESISRRHCRIYAVGDTVQIEDAGSRGGTWLNGERLTAPAALRDGDDLQIGEAKIEIQFPAERAAAQEMATIVEAAPMRQHRPRARPPQTPDPDRTMSAPSGASPDAAMPQHRPRARPPEIPDPDRTISAPPAASSGAGGGYDDLQISTSDFAPEDISVSVDKDELIIGRDKSCDVPLDNLMISRRHARIRRDGAEWIIEDLGSTNGLFVNDHRLVAPQALHAGDVLSIGPYSLEFDGSRLLSERPEAGAEIRISSLCQEVTDRETGKPKRLLDDITLTIGPRQFVGLLGTSGAGKSTFMGAIAGRRPASHGEVLLDGDDLYARFEALKAGIGFVPQEVIFHDSLPVIEALQYTSRLRLSKDATDEEVQSNLDRVLKTVGLTERRGTIIKNLSGGQKKLVSIAMELLSQPRVLFLDEVTSGLDPRTEKQMMHLFRELADSGITVVCITHYANSVEICDQIVYLNKGLLTFYGSPARYKEYFAVTHIEEAYEKEAGKTPVEWQKAFRESSAYHDFVAETIDSAPAKRRTIGAPAKSEKIDWPQLRRQLHVLTNRYIRVLTIDRRNLLLLLGLPPLTAVLLCILANSMEAAPPVVDQVTYKIWLSKQMILSFGPVIILFLLGMFGSVREIVKELSIYHHERFVNLRIVPYLVSKVFPLAVIGAMQTVSVIIIIKLFADLKAGSIFTQFVPLFLISLCGTLSGLAISAMVKSSDAAVVLMIGVVIPQILFSGALTEVRGAAAFIGKGFISAYWAVQAMEWKIEAYFNAHIGGYSPPRSHSWSMCAVVLMLHVTVFALLTFYLMVQKDGPNALIRIWRSLEMLLADLRARALRKRSHLGSLPPPLPAVAGRNMSGAVSAPRR